MVYTLPEFFELNDPKSGWGWAHGQPLPEFSFTVASAIESFLPIETDESTIIDFIGCFVEDAQSRELVHKFTELDFPEHAKKLMQASHHVKGVTGNARIAGLRFPAQMLEFTCTHLLAEAEAGRPERLNDPQVAREMRALQKEVARRIEVILSWYAATTGTGTDTAQPAAPAAAGAAP